MNTLMEGKETVEQAAMAEMGVEYRPHADQMDESFIKGAEFGAQWQSSHSIDRDKVIAVIRHYNDNIGIHDVYELIQRIKNI